MKIPVLKSQSELEIQKTLDYKALLTVEDDGGKLITLPDPRTEIYHWTGEKDGMKNWPPIFFNDICVFILSRHAGQEVDMRKRILNEYKEGKAFRYFDNKWMKEIYVCEVGNFCFLKGECTPSQRIGDLPHQIWVCAHRSGEIRAAYCTCVAG